MDKKKFPIFFLIIVFLASSSCITIQRETQTDTAKLVTAVMNSPSSIRAVYPGNLPSDFSSYTFLRIIKEKEKPPENDFEVLSQYHLEVIPKGNYYLPIVRDPITEKIILFDYSCTFAVDGQVFNPLKQYDLNHLEMYDPCKSPSL
jgi:hypothetical protein